MVVLLATLQAGDSAYGVTIKKEIERRTKREVSRGSVYITLERLERKALATWSEEGPDDPHRSGPLRRFAVTPSGVEALRESRRALDALSHGLDNVLGEVG